LPKTFISYSWESEEHKNWVLDLAARLRADGVEAILDQWHAIPGDQLPSFMENAVRESDYSLIICTPRYKDRSDKREGGVGYEGDIMTGEVFTTKNERKFIPILRQAEWHEAAPTWLRGKYYIDLRGAPYNERHYQDLLTTLLGTRPVAPPVGPGAAKPEPPKPAVGRAEVPAATAAFQPIRIQGVIADQIGTPKGDGTRGSALYRIPFRLTRRPPPEWAELFVEAWNHPRSFTSMHRPGIARVYGDTVVLDGTTVEEVERYHRDTLVLAAQEANERYLEWDRRRRELEDRERTRLEEHEKRISDAAKRLKF
jgi:hypothetical protein